MVSILRVAFTLTWDPTEVAGAVHTLENGTKLYLHGAGVSVLYDIAHVLNYKLEALYAEYNDAVALVANNVTDMGGLILSQDIKWQENGLGTTFVYLHPLDYESSYVYFRQPPTNSIGTTLIRPFTFNVWVILMSLMLLVSLIAKGKSVQCKISALSKILLFALELLIGRHNIHFRITQVPPSITISRLIVSFLGIVMCSLYTAKIASIFLLQENLIKTPTDLIKNGYEIKTYSWIHVNRLFEDLNERKRALKKMKYIVNFSGVSDVIDKKPLGSRQTLFAHPDGFYPQALYPLNYDKELCSVSMFKSTRKTPRSFYIRKDSVFREKLNIRILMFIERGINYRHNSVFKSQFQFNCDSEKTDYQQLTLSQLEVAFVILIVGAILSICSLLYSLISCQIFNLIGSPQNSINDSVYSS